MAARQAVQAPNSPNFRSESTYAKHTPVTLRGQDQLAVPRKQNSELNLAATLGAEPKVGKGKGLRDDEFVAAWPLFHVLNAWAFERIAVIVFCCSQPLL